MVEPAFMVDFLLAPELAQQLDAFAHASDALAAARAEGAELGIVAASDADPQHHAAFGKLVEARPLDGEKDRMAHGKARHAHDAESDCVRSRRRGAQHDDRFKPRLVDETVAE